MNMEYIPLDHTGQFPRLITDYVANREDMKVFFDFEPTIGGLKERLREVKQLGKDNALLAEVIKEQHGGDLSDSQSQNLYALQAEEAFTVCTGHQLCLFGGPVYMIYKIISTITLAQKLTVETGEKVIPLFWMASEDHDVDEVSAISLFGRRIGIESEHKGPVGAMSLDNIGDVLAELKSVLGDSQNADEAMSFLNSAYKGADSMAQAFRSLIQHLFGDSGILILDASDKRLKDSFREQMNSEVLEQITSSSIGRALDMLRNRGESVQATPREINLFYMLDDSRNRLVYGDDHIEVLEGPRWTIEEFKEELQAHPERFSPNVIFRPVYQEFLLPNLAYIGGPGELSYWLQLKDVFKEFGQKMPVLVLRDSFMWIDGKTEKKWKDLGFELIDLFREEDALYKEYALNNAEAEPDLSDDREVMVRQFDKLIEKSRAVDPGILGFAQSERTKLLKSIETFEKKLIRAEKKKHSDSLNRISNIKSKFLPGDSLRERKENFLHWYLRYGQEFFETLTLHSDPLDARIKVIKA